MKITWDANKNLINQRKHRLSFESAQSVFDDPLHLTRQDRIENGELRWQPHYPTPREGLARDVQADLF